ncbi:MAG: hypothetical protein ABI689_13815 [Thermoanaerobaculia bacterium]
MSGGTRLACLLLAVALEAPGALAQKPLGDEAPVSVNPAADWRSVLLPQGGERTLALWYNSFASSRLRGKSLGPLVPTPQELEFGGPGSSELTGADANSAGQAVLAFDGASGPFFQRFLVDGTLVGGVGQPYVTNFVGAQTDVFVREDGSFVLAYVTTDITRDDSTQQVSFRIYAANGTPLSGLVIASVQDDVFHYEPRVDGDRDGNFTIAWSAEVDAAFTEQNVYYRRYDRNGVPLGPPTALSETTAGNQYLGGFSCNLEGRCAAVWQSYAPDSGSFDIFFRILLPSGEPATGEIRANQYLPNTHSRPALSMNKAGEIAVSWTSEFQDHRLQDIYARLFRADGSPASNEFRVNELSADNVDDQSEILLSDEGSLRVAWVNFNGVVPSNYILMTRRFLRGCSAASAPLTLDNGRFEICSRWEDFTGRFGDGTPTPLRATSGGFWFFSPDNLELLAKTIDGCDYNSSFWTFAAGLTNLGVDLTILDRWTGRTRTYWNPPGSAYQPLLDIESLETCGAQPRDVTLAPSSLRRHEVDDAAGTGLGVKVGGTCEPDATHHCLQQGRFRVSVRWEDFAGHQGEGLAVPLSADSGLFWFFGSDNIEVAAKVLDGCAFNDRFWIYLAGLTNVAVRVEVEDTWTDGIWSRDVALGTPFPPFQDISAFATCAATSP